MAETMNVNIDTLPELGTKAAAVAAIESLIFRAIGAKDLEPLQLRYWLDAYYQARKAQEIEDEESPRTTEQQIDVHKLEEAISRWEHQRPHLIARVTCDGLRLSTAKSSEQDAAPQPDKPLPIVEAGPPRASAPTVETEYSGPDLAGPPLPGSCVPFSCPGFCVGERPRCNAGDSRASAPGQGEGKTRSGLLWF